MLALLSFPIKQQYANWGRIDLQTFRLSCLFYYNAIFKDCVLFKDMP